jgi:hypothetical protein
LCGGRQFKKIQKQPTLWATFFHGNSYELILTKMCWATSVTTSLQAHLVTLVCCYVSFLSPRVSAVFRKSFTFSHFDVRTLGGQLPPPLFQLFVSLSLIKVQRTVLKKLYSLTCKARPKLCT